MRKAVGGIIALVIIIVAAVLIFHKSPGSTNNNQGSTNNSGTNTASQAKTPVVNNAVVLTKTDSSVGQHLTDPSGRALYTYNADTSGVSNCTGSCLANWPAYQDTGSTTNLPAGISTLKRSDNGQIQYTYNGMPLYYFTSDSGTQVTGDGVENFSVAKPAVSTSSSSNNSSSTTSSSSGNSSSSGYPY